MSWHRCQLATPDRLVIEYLLQVGGWYVPSDRWGAIFFCVVWSRGGQFHIEHWDVGVRIEGECLSSHWRHLVSRIWDGAKVLQLNEYSTSKNKQWSLQDLRSIQLMLRHASLINYKFFYKKGPRDLVLHFSVRDILYHLYCNLTFCCLTKKMSDIIRYAELDNWMIRSFIITICFACWYGFD